MALQAPFPVFGGKSTVTAPVWRRFGKPNTYVEPFCRSAAMLLGSPHWPHTKVIETVNDAEGHIVNFWRAVKADPEAVAHYASNPVHESTLHAAHTWLTGMRSVLSARLEGDLDYYDAKVAGWWVWGASCWIGQGWCAGNGAWSTEIDDEGYTVLVKKPSSDGVSRQRQQITSQQGIFVTRQVSRPSAAGQGVNRSLPELASQRGVTKGSLRKTESLVLWMQDLADRFRDVRVLCGDWSRAVTPSVTTYHGMVAMFLDPPYDGKERKMGLYPIDSGTVASDTREWCLENGDDPQLRIALCGYSEHDELEHAGWEKFEWKANGGFGNQGKKPGSRGKANAAREVIWFSPHCLKPDNGNVQLSILDGLL